MRKTKLLISMAAISLSLASFTSCSKTISLEEAKQLSSESYTSSTARTSTVLLSGSVTKSTGIFSTYFGIEAGTVKKEFNNVSYHVITPNKLQSLYDASNSLGFTLDDNKCLSASGESTAAKLIGLILNNRLGLEISEDVVTGSAKYNITLDSEGYYSYADLTIDTTINYSTTVLSKTYDLSGSLAGTLNFKVQ